MFQMEDNLKWKTTSNSAGPDGGPRYRVYARLTLRSAPCKHVCKHCKHECQLDRKHVCKHACKHVVIFSETSIFQKIDSERKKDMSGS